MERRNAEPGFVDSMTGQLGGPRTSQLLTRLDALIPWEELARPIRKLYRHGSQGGRRPWPAVAMLKCMFLAKWFGLSDPQLEEALRDRLSFRRFVGLSLDDDTPDETTFVRFRQRLREAKLDAVLFEKTLAYLNQKGLIVKEGTLVDATILEAPKGKKRVDGSSTRDPQASFTKKHGRTYHGYKAHIATDRRGLITDYRFTTAKVHDSQCIDELIAHETDAVYADSAYMDQERSARLQSRGVYSGILRRRVRGEAELSPTYKLINHYLSGIRAIVEHPFAWIKSMGHRRVRYRGRVRNAFDFTMMAIAYDFKRCLSLVDS